MVRINGIESQPPVCIEYETDRVRKDYELMEESHGLALRKRRQIALGEPARHDVTD
jgi:hypothetical protein